MYKPISVRRKNPRIVMNPMIGPRLPSGRFFSAQDKTWKNRMNRNIRTGGLQGLELKYIDQNYAQTALQATITTTTATHDPTAAVLVMSTAQGDGKGDRDGIMQTTKSIFIKGSIVSPAVEVDGGFNFGFQYVIMMVLDMQTNGAAASCDALLQDAATTKTNCFRNIENSFRFKVLKEIRGRFVPQGVSNTAAVVNSFGCAKCVIPFKISHTFPGEGLKTRYSATTNDVANIRDNSVRIFAFVDTVTAQAPTIGYTSRCRFLA